MPEPKSKRTSVACRRCRRLRIKCVQEEPGTFPCVQCRKADTAESCAVPQRGDDRDRRHRVRQYFYREEHQRPSSRQSESLPFTSQQHRPRQSLSRDGISVYTDDGTLSPLAARRIRVYEASDVWTLLPPHDDLMAGTRVFVKTCIQVSLVLISAGRLLFEGTRVRYCICGAAFAAK